MTCMEAVQLLNFNKYLQLKTDTHSITGIIQLNIQFYIFINLKKNQGNILLTLVFFILNLSNFIKQQNSGLKMLLHYTALMLYNRNYYAQLVI